MGPLREKGISLGETGNNHIGETPQGQAKHGTEDCSQQRLPSRQCYWVPNCSDCTRLNGIFQSHEIGIAFQQHIHKNFRLEPVAIHKVDVGRAVAVTLGPGKPDGLNLGSFYPHAGSAAAEAQFLKSAGQAQIINQKSAAIFSDDAAGIGFNRRGRGRRRRAPGAEEQGQ